VPGRVGAATFTTRNIGQSSCFPGATNTITVTMGTDVNLAQHSTVNISGLTGAIATGQITLLDAGDDGEIAFAVRGTDVSQADWNDGTLLLTVKDGGNLSAGTKGLFTPLASAFRIRPPQQAHPQ